MRNLRETCDVYSYHQFRKKDINVHHYFLRTTVKRFLDFYDCTANHNKKKHVYVY